MTALLISGCENVDWRPVPPLDRACDRLTDLGTEHASGLSRDGGPISKRTGATYIAAVDGVCGAIE